MHLAVPPRRVQPRNGDVATASLLLVFDPDPDPDPDEAFRARPRASRHSAPNLRDVDIRHHARRLSGPAGALLTRTAFDAPFAGKSFRAKANLVDGTDTIALVARPVASRLYAAVPLAGRRNHSPP